MAKKNTTPRRRKKWSKIWLLNWVTILTFFIALIFVLKDNNTNFDFVDLHTWRPEHFIVTITGGYLLLEQAALLKTKKVDLVAEAQAFSDLDERKPKTKKGGK